MYWNEFEELLESSEALVRHPTLGYGRPVSPLRELEVAERSSTAVLHPTLGYGRPVRPPTAAAELDWEEREIIPPDERQLVRNTLDVPYRWVCALDLFFPDPDTGQPNLFRGSGTLISPRHILTAGHNLYDRVRGSRGTHALRDVAAVKVTPARNGAARRPADRAPLGSWWAAVVQISDRWRAARDPQFDYGLITLDRDIGLQRFRALRNRQLGFWGSKRSGAGTRIRPRSPSVLRGKRVNISGYPGDKCRDRPPVGSLTNAQIAACPTPVWASTQWRAYNRVANPSPASAPRMVLYDLDTFGGHSGSPVWLRWQQYRNLVAIHTAGRRRSASNEGVRITTDLLGAVRNWQRKSPASGRPVLRRGSRGPAVRELQFRLNAWIAKTPGTGLSWLIVDGIFGPRTQRAVQAFQRSRRIRVDGIVGTQTWGQLLAQP